MKVDCFTAGGFAQNTCLAWCGTTKEAIAVDPGAGARQLLRAVERRGLTLNAVVLTHAHLDHVEGIADVRDLYPLIPIHLHPLDRPLYDQVGRHAEMYGIRIRTPPTPTHELDHGQRVDVGRGSFEVRFSPGHSPGHVILVELAPGERQRTPAETEARTDAASSNWNGRRESSARNGRERVALVGDVVFAGSIGRTDLPGGNYATLLRSISDQVLTLADDTILYTGHGPPTTVAQERATNPFLQGLATAPRRE